MSFPGNEGNEVFPGVFNYTHSVHLNLKKLLFFLITITTATERECPAEGHTQFHLDRYRDHEL